MGKKKSKAKRSERAQKLTIKQEKFCHKYVECGNASEAYRSAYSCGNMKTETINRKAVELLGNGMVTARVKELQAELQANSKITKERIMEEHAKIAFSSIAHLHKTWIERTDFEQLTPDQKAAIKSISTAVRATASGDMVEHVKIELYDKQRSLDSLTKMMGYDAPQKLEVTGKDGKDLMPEPLKIELIKAKHNADSTSE